MLNAGWKVWSLGMMGLWGTGGTPVLREGGLREGRLCGRRGRRPSNDFYMENILGWDLGCLRALCSLGGMAEENFSE
ncbi:MAG: hypothetical protein AAGB46_01710, partial [Verrucomicrobiota bacterium]